MIGLFTGDHQFGIARAELIDSWSEASSRWIFPKLPGGLEHYRRQVPADTCAPIMIFENIAVDSSYRRQGLGSAGMFVTMRHFRELGARVAFLRVGTQGEDWGTGKEWRQRMYERLGWAALVNHNSYKGNVPLMWHSMKGDLACPRIKDVELRVFDDDPFGFEIIPPGI